MKVHIYFKYSSGVEDLNIIAYSCIQMTNMLDLSWDLLQM